MNENNGGPAFPLTAEATQVGQSVKECQGMTLRDYFAAAALQGELASESEEFCVSGRTGGKTREQMLAQNAYTIADAMIEARKKGQS